MGHNFKKQFGQNFLQSSRYPTILVDSLHLNEGDYVIEIGPGDGAVTKLLLGKGVEVICVEIDYDLIPKLIMKYRKFPNFHIVREDILKLSLWETLKNELKDKFNEASLQTVKIVGSLPYNISKLIIDKFVKLSSEDVRIKIDSMSFIVQDEVAKEYVAKPPKATFLSNYISLYSDIKKLESIPSTQFFPKPKVNGGILSIKPLKVEKSKVEDIIKFIHLGFSSPRKTLRNNLKASNLYDEIFLDKSLDDLKVGVLARPSELTQENWIALYNVLSNTKTS